MSEAWSTVVEREPEWDDYSRSEALALMARDLLSCRSCGQPDSVVPDRRFDRHMNLKDGRVVHVKAYRCLTCMALELVERTQRKSEESQKVADGVYAPADGRRYVAALTGEAVSRG